MVIKKKDKLTPEQLEEMNDYMEKLLEENQVLGERCKDFLDNVISQGNYFEEQLLKIKKKFPHVIEGVRGKGLLKGIKLKVENSKFINQLFEQKLLVVKASENVVRLLPPLIVNKNEIDEAISIIDKVCENF